MCVTSQFARRTLVWPAFGLFLGIALLVMTAACGWTQTDRPKLVTIGAPRMVKVGGTVKLRPRVAVADRIVVQLNAPLQAVGTLSLGGRVQGKIGRSLGRNMYVVDLPEGSDVVAVASALRGQAGVLAAEPDILTYPAAIPNDPQYSYQYHLPQIKAPAAWDVATGSAEVVIAIIDSGVYTDHPDLASKIWINTDEIAGNGVDDDANGYVDDVRGWDFYSRNNNPNPSPDGKDGNSDGEADEQVNHGTLVASTAAAAGNDGYGCCGVSWGAKIMALQVFPDDGGTAVSNVVSAINYAVANGADVINLSIGGDYTELFNAPLLAAYNAGVVVVCAGGNSGDALTDAKSTWESPVCNEGSNVATENHILGVGAVDRNDRKSSYSNWDQSTAKHYIDIMAPGDAIYGDAAYFPAFPAFTQYFQTNSGTSFASPIIAGVAAVLIGQNPGATVPEIMQMIIGAGDNIDDLNAGYSGYLGGGRINLARAVGVPLPPSPARDLTAVDTSGDNGGSLTITWQTSPDDGSGSNKVTGYSLFRREGTTGSFTRRAQLNKGSTQFIDTPVTDGTDYYYRLRTTDGTLTSDTDIVGPVQSRNDQAPALVSGMIAYDRPSDTGGAITVGWSAYTAPADFKAFIIYRAPADFATTSGLTPLATLTDPSATGYVDSAVTDGVDYYYAVGVRDTVGNETRSLRAFGPVQSFSNEALTFAAGLHFLGAPSIPTDADPATLFGLVPGSFQYARWAPTEALYQSDGGVRPLAEALQLDLGRGFWVKFPQAVTIRPDGRSAPAGDFSIELTPGWHQLANPFFGPITFAEATVIYQGAAMDLLSASEVGIMAAVAWTYDTSTKNYALAYPPLGDSAVLIPAWQGFWVKAYKTCTLVLARPAASTAVAKPTTAQARTTSAVKVDWSVRLRVSSAIGQDSECAVGTASRALTIPKPPPANGAPVSTLSAANSDRGGQYAVSLAQFSTSAIIWKLRIANLRAGQAVRVETPDLSSLPADLTPLLTDPVNGQSVYLRTSAAYAFTPRSGETERELKLTVSTERAAALQIGALTAAAVRSGGAQIAFTLSAPAACTVSIRNLAGREVRQLEEGKVRPAGNNLVLWDGRSRLGVKAPPGLYLLEISARTETGQSVRTIGSLKL